ncbi:MAG TPA: glycosyltransferase [Acidimicrobiales bacterium]|nr:glycosyltransferase [Acidimicrobiales bacterium]
MYASVVTTIADEPAARLQRMVDRVAAQTVGPLELLVAAPERDRATVDSLRAHGAVASVACVANPSGRRAPGLNQAVAAAACEVVHRVDARSLLAPSHVERCQKRLDVEPTIGVVGGRQHAVAVDGGVVARGVARALTNPWATGGASYRRPGAAGPVDTVYLGSFRRDELQAIGGYDERLDANEDFELCHRYRAQGQQVWLEDGLVVDYEARTGFDDVWRQYRAFGASKVRFWRARDETPNTRQLVGLVAPVLGVIGLGLAARRGHGVAAVGLAAAGAFALDHVAAEGDASLDERCVAAATSVIAPAAWAAGVYGEFFSRRRTRTAADAAPQANASPR